MATHQRSRSAILSGAKIVITEVGSYESNMLDIAARAEVSRATIYNHFVDKEEMMASLVESEVERLTTLAKKSPRKADALFAISSDISNDAALAKMIDTDHDDIMKLITVTGAPLWLTVQRNLAEIFGSDENSVGLILRWLLAQISAPLTSEQSRIQADRIASIL